MKGELDPKKSMALSNQVPPNPGKMKTSALKIMTQAKALLFVTVTELPTSCLRPVHFQGNFSDLTTPRR